MPCAHHSIDAAPKMACMATLALALLSGASIAQAQSSYTLTKLSTPFLGQANGVGQIDSQNRVTGTVGYATGYNLVFILNGSLGGTTYSYVTTRWPASTAASVSATKLTSQAKAFRLESPDGDKVFCQGGSESYYDMVKRQFVSVPAPFLPEANGATSWSVASIRNDGAMVGEAYVSSIEPSGNRSYALHWAPGAQAPDILPSGTFESAIARFINAQGTIAGEVAEAGATYRRAAVWRPSGDLEVLNQEPGRASRMLGLNDAGAVLIESYVPPLYADQLVSVISNGVAKPVLPLTSQEAVSAAILNANGVVVGSTFQRSSQQERAFIWKDGVTSDLTTWVKAKGAKLPVGAVLTNAWSINAQGSILATMRDAAGKNPTTVRLTAKP